MNHSSKQNENDKTSVAITELENQTA